MDAMEIIERIEKDNVYEQEALDYFMECVVKVNDVRMRCEQVGIVQCDFSDYGGDIEMLLEMKRGDNIAWIFLDDVKTLEVKNYDYEDKIKNIL